MWPKEYLYEGVHTYTLAVGQSYQFLDFFL